MVSFELIKTISNIRFELQASTSFSYDCITKRCNIGKEVWIKYYYGGTLEEQTFEINGAVGLGGTASIILYIENDNEIYNVYRYNGMLTVQRTIVDNIKHDVLTNLEDVITDLKEFLENK
jgi:hypothetical protein